LSKRVNFLCPPILNYVTVIVNVRYVMPDGMRRGAAVDWASALHQGPGPGEGGHRARRPRPRARQQQIPNLRAWVTNQLFP
jgi:hypothetical protein